jgi:hypothetical protein
MFFFIFSSSASRDELDATSHGRLRRTRRAQRPRGFTRFDSATAVDLALFVAVLGRRPAALLIAGDSYISSPAS